MDLRGAVASRLPVTRRGWILLIGVPLLIAALVVAVLLYLSKMPVRLADDYRERARPAVHGMADSMDRVYASFDTYLDESTIPLRQIRNVDDYDEFKRRVLPVYRATEQALEKGKRVIREARSEIDSRGAAIGDVPSAPLVNGKEAVRAADHAAAQAQKYVRQSKRYLRDYERFLEYERKAVDLQRRGLSVEFEDPGVGATIEEYRSAVDDAREDTIDYRKELLRLRPYPDTKRLYEIEVESIAISLDYLDDLSAAFDALSIPGLEAADRELLDESKRLTDQHVRAWQEFAASSGLQRSSVRLADQAEELEEAIATLGSGAGKASINRTRVPPPGPPKDGGGGSGGQLS